jgi:hypothetical protein
MADAHDACADKVRATVLKLSNALHNLTDKLSAFENDTAANATKSASADVQKGKGVPTSVNDRLEKLLNKQLHLQTGLNVLLEHKPYEDELTGDIQLTKIYISDRIAQSEKGYPLQVQIDALKKEVAAKDAVISTQTESLATLTATHAEVTASMVVASVQGPAAGDAHGHGPYPITNGERTLLSAWLEQGRD